MAKISLFDIGGMTVELGQILRLRVDLRTLEAARSAVGFMNGRSRDWLDADELLARGVMHTIQEIGEAAS